MSDLLTLLAVFAVLMLASEWIGRGAKRLRLPVITGFLLAGVLMGPYVLGLLAAEQVLELRIVDEVALAFIAFAAGAELVYREIRQQLKRIWWITIGIVVASYTLVLPTFLWLSGTAPFLDGMGTRSRLAVGLIAGAILVSRSPSSLMALITELRARGPFTKLLMGVTVALDVVVIMLFAVSTSVADVMLRDSEFRIGLVFLVLAEILAAAGVGAAVAGLVRLILRFGRWLPMQAVLVLGTGLGVYAASGWLRDASRDSGPFEVFLEPLLICMVTGFVVSNFTDYRNDFHRVLKTVAPLVYLGFFTLAGASLDLAALRLAWRIALLLLLVRLVAIVAGTRIGGWLGGAPPNVRRRLWLGMLTQAGIGLGLAKEVAVDFPEWGGAFATTMIAVIVVNQVFGPPPTKWVLRKLGEARTDLAGGLRRAPRALIFGLDGQSWALARQLADHDWRPTLVTRRDLPTDCPPDIEVIQLRELSGAALREIEADKARTLVGLMNEDDNLELSRLAHDELGVSNVVTRVASPEAASRAQRYGATAIDPNVALVNVLDHFVRSPSLTGLVVGMDADRDVIEIEVNNPDLDGAALRELRLPLDVLVLSVERNGASLISHGYTRLQRGDRVTVMGARSSLEQVEDRLTG
jgi:Trk K+ transport system NAD-binding subunit/Kef-type K+ transport system membrane component KefB